MFEGFVSWQRVSVAWFPPNNILKSNERVVRKCIKWQQIHTPRERTVSYTPGVLIMFARRVASGLLLVR